MAHAQERPSPVSQATGEVTKTAGDFSLEEEEEDGEEGEEEAQSSIDWGKSHFLCPFC